MSDQTSWQAVKARGGQLVAELGRLLHEGNVRRRSDNDIPGPSTRGAT